MSTESSDLSADDALLLATLRDTLRRLDQLQAPLEEPEPGDWLTQHYEPGQTFDQYLRHSPTTARTDRRVIYIQPLGEFTPSQRRVLELTVEFLERFFLLPVHVSEDLPLSVVPASAQRTHPEWGDHQILTRWVLRELLIPTLPEDGAALICLTAADLWPGEGWNFVFGQADIRRRVAVWSMYRNGDPSTSPEALRLCFVRTAKTAAHELCHVFSLRHEIRYRCLMSGSNHREEADRRPLWLCHESLAKLCWATGVDPTERLRGLEAFCSEHGLAEEERFYRRAVQKLVR